MKLYFNELKDYSSNRPLEINETINVQQQLLQRFPDQVLDASEFKISGVAFTDKGDVVTSLHVEGTLTVPSTRSLRPVDLPVEFQMDEIYVNSKAAEQRYDDEEAVFMVNEDGKIDIDNAVAENIVLQIPMIVLSSDEIAGNEEMPKGNGWEVLSSEEFQKRQEDTNKVDPRLAKLSQFFDDSEG